MNDAKQPRYRFLVRHPRLSYASLVFAILLIPFLATSLSEAQTFTVLYSFSGAPDGGNPYGGLVMDTNGNLYGTTYDGGVTACYPDGCGTVFRVDPTGKETVLYTFTGGADGAYPTAGVLRVNGNLYGTTVGGGGSGFGTGLGLVFKVDKKGKETVLHTFTAAAGDGSYPWAGLVRDKAGNLYGATTQGGDLACGLLPPQGCGIIFKLDPIGNETVLHAFTGLDGAFPYASLLRDSAGNLYGTTVMGGTSNGGTVFDVDNTDQFTLLHSLSKVAYSEGALLRDGKGNLYGTSYFGGDYDLGAVFKLDPAGNEYVLYSFKSLADGLQPEAGLVRDRQGNLYGTTRLGGDLTCTANGSGCGTVFKIDRKGNHTVLHSFTLTDGAYPSSPLVQDKLGNLYGTAKGGGNPACQTGYAGCGTVFKLAPQ